MTSDRRDEGALPDNVLAQGVDVVTELGEVALDRFLAEGALREVPLLGTVIGVVRGGFAFRDYVFEKKLLAFLRLKPDVSPNERERFKKKLEDDPGFRERTAAHLVVVLDRLDDLEKAPVLARIFSALVAGRVTPNQMRRCCSILDSATLPDLLVLEDAVKTRRTLTRQEFGSLEGAGLAALQHSIVRPHLPEEINVRVDYGGTSLICDVNPDAVIFVSVAFP